MTCKLLASKLHQSTSFRSTESNWRCYTKHRNLAGNKVLSRHLIGYKVPQIVLQTDGDSVNATGS